MKKIYFILGLSLLLFIGCSKQQNSSIIDNSIIKQSQIEQDEKLKDFIITNPKENLKIHYLNNEKVGIGSSLFVLNDNIPIYKTLVETLYQGTYSDKAIYVTYKEKSNHDMTSVMGGVFTYLNKNELENAINIKSYFYKDGNEIELNKEELQEKVNKQYTFDIKNSNEESNEYYKNICSYYGFDEMYTFVNIDNKYIVAFYSKDISDNYRIEIVLSYSLENLNKEFKIKSFDDFTKDFFIDNFCQYTIVEDKPLNTNYKLVDIKGDTYYMMIDSYKGEYNQIYFDCKDTKEESIDFIPSVKLNKYIDYNKGKIVDYNTYSKICEDFGFKKKYNDKNINYFVIIYGNYHSWYTLDIVDFIEKDDCIDFYYKETTNGVMGSGNGYFTVIPTNKNIDTSINAIKCFNEEEIEYFSNYEDLDFKNNEN